VPTSAVNGIDIYHEVHGEGPPLMYISGTGNDLRRSPASILPVTRCFETLSYDQRGLGRTSKPGGDYSMADDADDAAALADRLPRATLRVFDGGHTFLVQDRTAFPEIIDFLRGES